MFAQAFTQARAVAVGIGILASVVSMARRDPHQLAPPSASL
jgi:hypothetical protein